MKSLFTVIFLVSLAFSSEASRNGFDEVSLELSESVGNDGADVSSVVTTVEHKESEIESDNLIIHDSDSSEYSVNKFNFLFYLIYKVQYADFEEEDENEIEVKEPFTFSF
ncbi:MAG: hypothetical protein JXR07_16950 [Reichenbachiella sp.]